RFSHLFRAISHPARRLSLRVASSRHAIGRREIGIELDRPVEHLQRLIVGPPGPPIPPRHAAQIVVIGVKTFGWLALGSLDFGLLQLWGDCSHDARRYLVLQIEDFRQPSVETVGPQMATRRRIDELSDDSYLVAGL